MSKSKIKFETRGLSIIEAVIAIAILTIGIFSLIKIFPLTLDISRTAEQATIATNLAQAKIEEMFYLDYDGIAVGTVEAKHRLSDDPQNPFYHYQRQTAAEYVDGNLNHSESATGLKKITVTAFWPSAALPQEKNVVLTILISQK